MAYMMTQNTINNATAITAITPPCSTGKGKSFNLQFFQEVIIFALNSMFILDQDILILIFLIIILILIIMITFIQS